MFVIGFNLTSGFCARNKRNRTYAVLVEAQHWRLAQLVRACDFIINFFMNSKQKGNIVEVEVMLAFLKLGINVLNPYGDCERYDFVVEINGQFYKIQCKMSQISEDGSCFSFTAKSSNRVNGKSVSKPYTSEEIDFFATTYNGECYLIDVKECGVGKRLRLEKPKNNQEKNICFAEDYEIKEVLKKL